MLAWKDSEPYSTNKRNGSTDSGWLYLLLQLLCDVMFLPAKHSKLRALKTRLSVNEILLLFLFVQSATLSLRIKCVRPSYYTHTPAHTHTVYFPDYHCTINYPSCSSQLVNIWQYNVSQYNSVLLQNKVMYDVSQSVTKCIPNSSAATNQFLQMYIFNISTCVA